MIVDRTRILIADDLAYRPEGFARLVARVLSGSLVLPR
jgi:hypothetical protein